MNAETKCSECAHGQPPFDGKLERLGYVQCDMQARSYYRGPFAKCVFTPSRFTPKGVAK